MTMSRRAFLSLGGAAVAAGAAGAITGPAAWRELVHHHVQEARSDTTPTTADPPGASPGPRVLVVIDLGGGNDGLNTLVPADGRYRDARPTLAVPESSLVALPGTTAYGLNPALRPLEEWWADGSLVAVNGLAIPDQTRSHFLASDVWWTAQPGSPHGTGWLGRWLDEQHDVTNPLRAISLGLANQALVGRVALPTVVADPRTFALLAPPGADADTLTGAFLATAHPASSEPVLRASQLAVPDAVAAVRTLTPALGTQDDDGADTSSADITVTDLLGVAAGIIDLRIGTQVLMVSVTGFDTHADQAARHPELLADLARGLDAFLAEMRARGRADEVLVVTTSEFGRRVEENGSGTDHGQASVQFLAGAEVAGGRVVGTADLAHLDDGDLPLRIDTRSVYAAALDWLGGPTDDILGAKYDRLGLLH